MLEDRLREERERLRLTQEVFAEAAGAKRRTLIDWEKGVSSPTAVQLSALSEIGVDVLYVLTGKHQQNSSEQSGAVEIDLVVKIASILEALLTKHRARLSLAKKQELVRLLYDHFALKGAVDDETVERHLKLVVNQ